MLVGALLCEPVDPGCAAGVMFFNNAGFLGMCGHGMIGTVVTLAHLGRLSVGTHRMETPVGLVTVESEYRSLIGPVLAYVDARDRVDPDDVITVVLPEYVARWPWERLLHNQSAQRLKKVLLERANAVVIEVPYHVG